MLDTTAKNYLDSQFSKIFSFGTQIIHRLDKLENRVNKLEVRLGELALKVEQKSSLVDLRIGHAEAKLSERIDGLAVMIQKHIAEPNETRFISIEMRLTNLEMN